MTTVNYRDFSSQSHMLTTDGGAWEAWRSNGSISCTSVNVPAPSLILAFALVQVPLSNGLGAENAFSAADLGLPTINPRTKSFFPPTSLCPLTPVIGPDRLHSPSP